MSFSQPAVTIRSAQAEVCAVALTRDPGAREQLQAVFQAQGWRLWVTDCWHEVELLLGAGIIRVLLVDGDLREPSWREVLDTFPWTCSGHAPKVVVLSRVTEEAMWAEVLNLGGFDLLAKPLAANQVHCVIRQAFQEWHYALGNGRRSLGALEKSAAGP